MRIPLATVNRHGLVAGATGTGKTKSLQVIAEQLSAAGVPVLMADVKGDLSGLSRPGEANDKIAAARQGHRRRLDADRRTRSSSCRWAPSGIGVPVRATITSFGPILLSKVLGLNATQESTLGLIFHWADQKGLPLLDLKDLRAVIQYLTSDEGKPELKSLGAVSPTTAGVILRALVNLEAEGADTFFGEPELEPKDLMRVDAQGRGIITPARAGRPGRPAGDVLHVPDVGARRSVHDAARGRRRRQAQAGVLLRRGASAVHRRVQGVPGAGRADRQADPVQGRRRVLLHAAADRRAQRRAVASSAPASSTRCARSPPTTRRRCPRPSAPTRRPSVYDLESALTSLGIGEAIVTVLSEKGAPTPVAWTRMRAPRSLMDTIGPDAITAAAKASPLQAEYGQTVDRESAYERLNAKLAPPPSRSRPTPTCRLPLPVDRRVRPAPRPVTARDAAEPGMFDKMMNSPAFKSAMRSAGTVIGREITRSIFGTGRRRR